VTLVSTNQCGEKYYRAARWWSTSRTIREDVNSTLHICGDWPSQGDSCKGDSGSALVVATDDNLKDEDREVDDKDNTDNDDETDVFVAVGIYSMGGAKCRGELPGIFTNITTYLPWIFSVVAQI